MHISEVKKYSTKNSVNGEAYYRKKGRRGWWILLYDKKMMKKANRRYIKAGTRKEMER